MSLDYDTFYVFDEESECKGALRGSVQSTGKGENLQLLLGNIRPSAPLLFRHHEGSRPMDVVWTAALYPFCVSRRVLDVLTGGNFTGWCTYPVEVHDGTGRVIDDYHGLAITGRSGPIDNTRSDKVWRGPHYEGGPKWQNYVGMFFQDDRWDGSDFFIPEGTAWKIVTERLKKAVESLNIPNVAFERLSTLERDAR